MLITKGLIMMLAGASGALLSLIWLILAIRRYKAGKQGGFGSKTPHAQPDEVYRPTTISNEEERQTQTSSITEEQSEFENSTSFLTRGQIASTVLLDQGQDDPLSETAILQEDNEA